MIQERFKINLLNLNYYINIKIIILIIIKNILIIKLKFFILYILLLKCYYNFKNLIIITFIKILYIIFIIL